jgi:hypothetical protein
MGVASRAGGIVGFYSASSELHGGCAGAGVRPIDCSAGAVWCVKLARAGRKGGNDERKDAEGHY